MGWLSWSVDMNQALRAMGSHRYCPCFPLALCGQKGSLVYERGIGKRARNFFSSNNNNNKTKKKRGGGGELLSLVFVI